MQVKELKEIKLTSFVQNFLKLHCYNCFNTKNNSVTKVSHSYTCLLKLPFFFFVCDFYRNGLVKDLCTHVGTENNIPAWIVLYCLSTQMDFKNPMFTIEYYRQTVVSSEVSTDKKLVMCVS